jgi:hydroxyacylglutathione hydrolase
MLAQSPLLIPHLCVFDKIAHTSTLLQTRIKEVAELRKLGKPTVPTNLGVEKKTNPFLRCDISEEIRQNVGVVSGDTDAEVFGKVRRAKDIFRG